jgi:hypothetical protein
LRKNLIFEQKFDFWEKILFLSIYSLTRKPWIWFHSIMSFHSYRSMWSFHSIEPYEWNKTKFRIFVSIFSQIQTRIVLVLVNQFQTNHSFVLFVRIKRNEWNDLSETALQESKQFGFELAWILTRKPWIWFCSIMSFHLYRFIQQLGFEFVWILTRKSWI